MLFLCKKGSGWFIGRAMMRGDIIYVEDDDGLVELKYLKHIWLLVNDKVESISLSQANATIVSYFFGEIK